MTTVLEPTTTRFAAIDDFGPAPAKAKGKSRTFTTLTVNKHGYLSVPTDFLRRPARVAVDYSAATRTLRVRTANPDDLRTLKVNESNAISLRGVLQALGLFGKRLHWATRYIENGCLYLPLDEAEVSE